MDNKYYIYETHMHTSEGSACGMCSGAEMARAYKAAGYSGIIITDHFFYGNTAADRSLPWEEWVNAFCLGYENAKKEGDRIGLNVFFGWESGYNATEFLIYGLDKQWLLTHPEIKDATIPEQLELVHNGGGIVIQAHPFREAPYVPIIRVAYKDVDGMEGVNATHSGLASRCHNHPEFNTRAIEFATSHNFPMTAGSDQHTTEMIYGGMVFDHPINSIHEFTKAVMNRDAVELLDGSKKMIEKYFKI